MAIHGRVRGGSRGGDRSLLGRPRARPSLCPCGDSAMSARPHGLYCRYCYENVRGRANHPGHIRFQKPRSPQETLSAMIRRQSDSPHGGDTSPFAARDTVMEADTPLLFEYLSHRQFEDGSMRETSTLMVFASEGLWKGCLNDRQEGRALWASAETIGGLLEALERCLDHTHPDWRPVKKFSPKK